MIAHSKAGSDWLSIGQLSQRYGISQPTIRTMCDNGLPHYLTAGMHRRLSESEFRRFIGLDKPSDATLPRICIVCRVSTPAQAKPRTDGPDAKSDLDRQIERCRKYVKDRWGDQCVVEENVRVTSGLNFNAPQLIDFTLKLVQKQYDYVVISWKDRLARSSFDLWLNLAKYAGTEIIMCEQQDDPTFTESLVEDLIALCTVASCKHNSAKAAKNSTIHVEQEDLLRIYARYREGSSYASLSTWCEAQGITGVQAGVPKPLTAPKLCQIIGRYHTTLDKLIPETTNHLAEFASECLTAKPGYTTKQVDIYERYLGWCKVKGYVAISVKKVGAGLKKLGYQTVKANGGLKHFRGVAILDVKSL